MEPHAEDLTESPTAPSAEIVSPSQPRISLWTLAWVFFRVGATGFGDTWPLLAPAYRIGKRTIALQQPVTVVIALLAFVAGAVLGVHVALIAVVGGLLGMLLLAPPPAPSASTGG